jgi:hypothetical protein
MDDVTDNSVAIYQGQIANVLYAASFVNPVRLLSQIIRRERETFQCSPKWSVTDSGRFGIPTLHVSTSPTIRPINEFRRLTTPRLGA